MGPVCHAEASLKAKYQIDFEGLNGSQQAALRLLGETQATRSA
jgi:hypothetical protein